MTGFFIGVAVGVAVTSAVLNIDKLKAWNAARKQPKQP